MCSTSRLQAAGQYNYMSTSTDLTDWTAPEVAFSAVDRAVNPVPCTPNVCVQWQPNLFTLANGSLGCVWSGSNGVDGHVDSRGGGTYVSVLDDPHGRWTNRLITFENNHNSPHPAALGKNWTLFATQNPFVLRSGRILAPVVLTDASNAVAPDAPPGCHNGTFKLCTARRSSVLISDDGGLTWRCSPGTIIPGYSWANWEPTVWQDTDSPRVYMISRFNDFRTIAEGGPHSDAKMQWATSDDGGETWASLTAVPVDTVVSRAEVMPQRASNGKTARWLMVENDWNAGDQVGTSGRLNTALWIAPALGADRAAGSPVSFSPGVGLSPTDVPAFYPQMWQSNETLAVSWSLGTSPRSIQVAHLLLPPTNAFVISVRNDTNWLQSPRPFIERPWASFFGQQSLVSSRPLMFPPSARQFSVGVWAKVLASSGTQGLIDGRASAESGVLVGLHNTIPFIFLGVNASMNKTDNIEPSPDSALATFSFDVVYSGSWMYIGISVDTLTGTALFVLASGTSGQLVSEVVPFHPRPLNQSLSSSPYNITLGNRNNPPETHTSIAGLSGLLGTLALYPTMWGLSDHAAFANRAGRPLKTAPIRPKPSVPSPSPTAAVQPLVYFNASDVESVAHDFPLPASCGSGSVPTVSGNGSILDVCGLYSASVELPAVSCRAGGPTMRISARVKLMPPQTRTSSGGCPNEMPSRWTVLTVGDSVAHTRLLVELGPHGALAGSLHCSLNNHTISLPAWSSSTTLGEWTSIELEYGVNGSTTFGKNEATFSCGCTMGGVWTFLGEGYMDRKYNYSTACVQHDTAQLQITTQNS